MSPTGVSTRLKPFEADCGGGERALVAARTDHKVEEGTPGATSSDGPLRERACAAGEDGEAGAEGESSAQQAEIAAVVDVAVVRASHR